MRLFAAALLAFSLQAQAQELCTGDPCTAHTATTFQSSVGGLNILDSFVKTIGTLNATPIANQYGIAFSITGAGSGTTFTQSAVLAYMPAGFTGNKTTSSIYALNESASTAKNYATSFNNSALGNVAVRGQSIANTAGAEIGLHGIGRNTGSGPAAGVVGMCENGALCEGGHFTANGGTTKVAIFAGIAAATAPVAGVIVADNGFSGEPILVTRANGLQALTIEATGALRLGSNGMRPACDAAHRRVEWYTEGGPGGADTFSVCMKDAADSYAWTP